MMTPLQTAGYRSEIPVVNVDNRAKLKEQTDAFEAIILKMLLDQSIQAKDPLLPKDPGRDIYRSMMNDARSKQLSGAFGYSELLFNYLVEKKS
jgi:Rod binding domain-containing protein